MADGVKSLEAEKSASLAVALRTRGVCYNDQDGGRNAHDVSIDGTRGSNADSRDARANSGHIWHRCFEPESGESA